MRTHKVKSRETLSKIARKYYGDAGMYQLLADFNGIRNPNRIHVGRILEIPSRRELVNPTPIVEPAELALEPPHGLEQMQKVFGNIYSGISKADGTLSRTWEAKHFGRAKLPFPIKLSWNLDLEVRNLYCHVKLKEIYPEVFATIERKRLKKHILTYGGCFNFRRKRGGSKLSTHSWGIAIDLNTATNRMGRPGDMNPEVVQVFKDFGFTWGGDWTGRYCDPMHFQYCSGY